MPILSDSVWYLLSLRLIILQVTQDLKELSFSSCYTFRHMKAWLFRSGPPNWRMSLLQRCRSTPSATLWRSKTILSGKMSEAGSRSTSWDWCRRSSRTRYTLHDRAESNWCKACVFSTQCQRSGQVMRSRDRRESSTWPTSGYARLQMGICPRFLRRVSRISPRDFRLW